MYRCCIVVPSLRHITLIFNCLVVAGPYRYLWAMLCRNQSSRMIHVKILEPSFVCKKILSLRKIILSDLFKIKLGLIRSLRGYVLKWMYNVNIKLIRDSRPSVFARLESDKSRIHNYPTLYVINVTVRLESRLSGVN